MAIYDSRYTRTQLDEGIGAGYVPTLQAAPTSSTTSYTRSDLPSGSQTVSFVVGQMCRVAVTGGYDFYQLKDVSGNTATWEKTNYRVMGASGSGHASGLVPDPGSTAGTTKFLREDGTWQIPESGGSVIPVVLLYEPSTPEAGMVMFDAIDTNKFYQYTMQSRWVEISIPHKAIGISSNDDDWYEIIDGVLSQTPIADFELNTWYIYYIGGEIHQIGQVVFTGVYGGGVLPTFMDVYNWNNKQDAITFNSTYDATTNPAATMADVSGKEDKMSIVTLDESISTLSPAVNTLYVIQSSTLDVTLPTITDTTKVQSFVVVAAFGGIAPSITIHGTQDNICGVYMPTDISIEQRKTYEINCMFCGQITFTYEGQSITYNNWSVAIRDIGEGAIQ